MATISLTRSYPTTDDFHRGAIRIYSATPLTNAGSDVTATIGPDHLNYRDRSVHVFGTFGAAGNLRIEGSYDGTNYAALADAQGNVLDITTAKIEEITVPTPYLRARVTAGDGTTSLTVYFGLGQNPL